MSRLDAGTAGSLDGLAGRDGVDGCRRSRCRPIRRPPVDGWTSCGGCAAKWGAALLTDMVRHAGWRRPIAADRPGAIRRRCDLRDGARHCWSARPISSLRWSIIPATSAQSRGKCVQRRLRDGWPTCDRGQHRRLPGALPAPGDRGHLRCRRPWCARLVARSPAVTRSAIPSRSSASPCRSGGSSTCLPQGRRGDRATCWCSASRSAPGWPWPVDRPTTRPKQSPACAVSTEQRRRSCSHSAPRCTRDRRHWPASPATVGGGRARWRADWRRHRWPACVLRRWLPPEAAFEPVATLEIATTSPATCGPPQHGG